MIFVYTDHKNWDFFIVGFRKWKLPQKEVAVASKLFIIFSCTHCGNYDHMNLSQSLFERVFDQRKC